MAFGLVLVAAALLIAGGLAVIAYQDVAPFNKFASSYNSYAGRLQGSVNDQKALDRMLKARIELWKSQHWEPCK